MDDPRWGDDARDCDSGSRDLSRGGRGGGSDSRDRERERVDPREVFADHVRLPRGQEREHVWVRERYHMLRGSESRTLASVGAFRAIPAGDLRDTFDKPLDPRHGELWHLREAGLVCRVGQPAVLNALKAALGTVATLGASIRDVKLLDFDELFRVSDLLAQPEMAVWFEHFFEQYGATFGDTLHAERGWWIGLGVAVSAVDYLRASQRRRELQIAFARAIRDVDVVMLPSYFLARRPFPASAADLVGGYPEIGGRTPAITDAFRYGMPFNFLGLPAISVPCGIGADGAVGLQIVGRAWDEAGVLRAARAYEGVTEWHRMWPTLT